MKILLFLIFNKPLRVRFDICNLYYHQENIFIFLCCFGCLEIFVFDQPINGILEIHKNKTTMGLEVRLWRNILCFYIYSVCSVYMYVAYVYLQLCIYCICVYTVNAWYMQAYIQDMCVQLCYLFELNSYYLNEEPRNCRKLCGRW